MMGILRLLELQVDTRKNYSFVVLNKFICKWKADLPAATNHFHIHIVEKQHKKRI